MELQLQGGVSIRTGEGEQEADCVQPRGAGARGTPTWVGAGRGRGVALHRHGVRGRRVPEHVAKAGVADYRSRGGAYLSHRRLPLGYSGYVLCVGLFSFWVQSGEGMCRGIRVTVSSML